MTGFAERLRSEGIEVPGVSVGSTPGMWTVRSLEGVTEARLTALSQEHGILSAPRPVGSRVRVLPNHSCLASACFDEYLVVRGPEVVDRWKIWRGR